MSRFFLARVLYLSLVLRECPLRIVSLVVESQLRYVVSLGAESLLAFLLLAAARLLSNSLINLYFLQIQFLLLLSEPLFLLVQFLLQVPNPLVVRSFHFLYLLDQELSRELLLRDHFGLVLQLLGQ